MLGQSIAAAQLSSPLPLFCLQLLDSDQDLYKNFPLVISERWQQEVAETVYEAVNSDTDKNEARKRAKNKQQGHEEGMNSTVALTTRPNRCRRGLNGAPRGNACIL